jgi:TM2 domain-containing membrane protein YozV
MISLRRILFLVGMFTGLSVFLGAGQSHAPIFNILIGLVLLGSCYYLYKKLPLDGQNSNQTLKGLGEIGVMSRLTTQQQFLFASEMSARRKKKSTALLLTALLGGIGAHHFYFENTGMGILYALFCWTFIPAICAFFEIFTAGVRVDAFNENLAQQIATKILMIAPEPTPTP